MSSDLLHRWAGRGLLLCGVLYGVSYVAVNDGIAASASAGYSRTDQAVSELSAVGASTRPFLLAMLPVWTALMVGFGAGIISSAAGNRALRALGWVTIAQGGFGVLWLWFPMTSREEMVRTGTGVNDAGHLWLSAGTGVFVLAELILLALAFGAWARVFAAVSLVVMIGFNTAMASMTDDVKNGAPTARMGLYERVGMAPWLLWMAVVSIVLLRRSWQEPAHRPSVPAGAR